jgi:hypothetical protein
MLELVYKANAIIDLINPMDSLKIMEMSINRNDIMCKSIKNSIVLLVDKSKIILLKADKLYIVIPLTITKVETKLKTFS